MVSSLLTEKHEGEVAHSPVPPRHLALCEMICKLSDREAEATIVGKIGALQGVNTALLHHAHSCHRHLLHRAPAANIRRVLALCQSSVHSDSTLSLWARTQSLVVFSFSDI